MLYRNGIVPDDAGGNRVQHQSLRAKRTLEIQNQRRTEQLSPSIERTQHSHTRESKPRIRLEPAEGERRGAIESERCASFPQSFRGNRGLKSPCCRSRMYSKRIVALVC